MSSPNRRLVEREDVLAEIAARGHAVAKGDSSIVLVVGGAGLGKSSVLSHAHDELSRAGLRPLHAACSQLEQSYAFGVVRQLLALAVPRDAGQRETLAQQAVHGAASRAVADPFSVLDELFWALASLTDEAPLAIVVDDLQWCDEPSLRWLGFVERRMAGLPLLAVLASRPTTADRPHLAELFARPQVRHIELAPLTVAGSAELLNGQAGGDVSESLAARCHELTEGNPLYLSILARQVRELGPGSLDVAAQGRARALPETVRRAVLTRLHAHGAEASALARAVAVLGSEATLGLAARLAGISPDEARDAAKRLADADVLRFATPLSFVHPLVHSAVYDDLGPDREALHSRAARLLADERAPEASVAAHLLSLPPGEDPWVVATLVQAAGTALGKGAPESAMRYLRRALDERVAHGQSALLLQLGRTEMLAGDSACVSHLDAALQVAEDDEQRTAAAEALARALAYHGRAVEAIDVLEGLREQIPADAKALRLRLDLAIAGMGTLDVATLPRSDEALRRCQPIGDPLLDRHVRAQWCVQPARHGTSARHAVELAREVLKEAPVATGEGLDDMGAQFPAIALMLSDELHEAHAEFTRSIDEARERGAVPALAMSTNWRSHCLLRLGDVVGAGVDAQTTHTIAIDAGLHVLLPYAISFLTDAMLERGELEEAEKLWAPLGLDAELPLLLPFNYVLYSRGCLHFARGRPDEAARDMLESGRRQTLWHAEGVSFWQWASRAALALTLLGERAQALELVEREESAARAFGAPRALGMALRVKGLLAQGAARVRVLEEARDVLLTSVAALEQARVSVDLGVALLRVGRREAGLSLLHEAHAGAVRCGALALAEQARAELAAVGVRARKLDADGIESLTITERRVAELARSGMTNREIARSLFVAPKTVETHLSRVFRKLQITSRAELQHGLPSR